MGQADLGLNVMGKKTKTLLKDAVCTSLYLVLFEAWLNIKFLWLQ